MQQKPEPTESSLRISQNFAFFQEQVRSLEATGLALLCKGLAKLTIVDIALSRDQDNPQLIFESMNSTGRELSQADLIRNLILMGLEPTQSYVRKLVTELSGGVFGYLDSVLERHSFDEFGELI